MTDGVREYKTDARLVHGQRAVTGLAHVVEVTRGERGHLSLVVELTTDQQFAAMAMVGKPESVVLFLGDEERRALVRLHSFSAAVDYFSVEGTGFLSPLPKPGTPVIVVTPNPERNRS